VADATDSQVEALVRDIERALQGIWLHEPEELARVRQGILDNDAGTYGQWFSAYHDIHHELRWFSEHALPMLIQATINPKFTVRQGKDLARRLIAPRMDFLGWLGQRSFPDFANRYLALADSISSATQLQRVLIALEKYAHRLLGWTTHFYPWGAAGLFPAQTESDMQSLRDLVRQV
jgi:hypothetical protein